MLIARIARVRGRCAVLALAAVCVAAGSASAATVYDALSATTVLHGGDRELTALSFAGSTTAMSGADFLRFNDGYVFDSAGGGGLYGWTDKQPRDVSTAGNAYYFNPDRADGASAYADEGAGRGALGEVFGSFGGYKNMSYLLDGEEREPTYYVDLYFDGFTLSGDADATSIEVALLERGGNSKMKVYGILAADTPAGGYTPTLTSTSVLVNDTTGTFNPLWQLNTLEIGEFQGVRGYGISIDESWTNLVGLRIASEGSCYKGPDLVGVGVVPEPATMVLLALGGAGVLVRRRRRR